MPLKQGFLEWAKILFPFKENHKISRDMGPLDHKKKLHGVEA